MRYWYCSTVIRSWSDGPLNCRMFAGGRSVVQMSELHLTCVWSVNAIHIEYISWPGPQWCSDIPKHPNDIPQILRNSIPATRTEPHQSSTLPPSAWIVDTRQLRSIDSCSWCHTWVQYPLVGIKWLDTRQFFQFSNVQFLCTTQKNMSVLLRTSDSHISSLLSQLSLACAYCAAHRYFPLITVVALPHASFPITSNHPILSSHHYPLTRTPNFPPAGQSLTACFIICLPLVVHNHCCIAKLAYHFWNAGICPSVFYYHAMFKVV